MKKLEILHFNDFHSDFFSRDEDGKITGGISFLSDYIWKEKNKEENALLFFAGDAVSGNINDSEYKGISTFAMFNHLGIDVMCPGNHEVDYGIGQLATMNQLANFEIVCANINIAYTDRKFLKPYTLIEKGGLSILVIGIITTSISKVVEIDKDSYEAFYVGDYNQDIDNLYETDEYKKADILVVLSHIGYEEDKVLANRLRNEKPTIIIGGHSHTLLNKPEYVNNIPIVQTGLGSSRIGKFNIYFDENSKQILNTDYSIEIINEDNCENNPKYDEYLSILHEALTKKYDNVICTLPRTLHNENRNLESEFCDFFSDMFNEICETDLFLFDPGCTKATSIGPVIKYGDLKQVFTRSNELIKCAMTGLQLKKLFSYTLEHYGFTNNKDIFLQQPSKDIKVIFNSNNKLISLLYKDNEIKDDDLLSVGMFEYSLNNSLKKFSIPTQDIIDNRNIVSKHPDSTQAFYNYCIDCEYNETILDIDIYSRYISKNI